ncbi:hypothetical protein ACCO45_002563 [Purpureocillium lilacinum]|uniref:Uncharacterized protein n=1 Tax=Purpureocillium lilacinum TaxID=33203 RepID=A0ACC4EBE0_PURLI
MGALARWAKKAEVRRSDDSPTPSFLDNDDLRPLRLKDRTWGRLVWLMFWLSSASSPGNWQAPAACIAAGLSAWETIIAMLTGRAILEALIVANGRCGAVYHMPLPALIRSSWGVSWSRRGTTTGQFIGILIFWYVETLLPAAGFDANLQGGIRVLMLGADLIPVPKLKSTIYIKVVVFFASAFALLGWIVHLGGGIGPVFTAPSRVHGSEKAWLVVRFFLLFISNSTTFIMNAADWQRYSKKPSDPIIMQMVGGPIAHVVISLIGALVASSGALIYKKVRASLRLLLVNITGNKQPQWNPILLIDQILADNYNPRVRAACFFLGLAFTYSSLVSVVLSNGLPAGNDLAGLFPKYINYRRGTILAGCLCIVICPWRLIATATAFLAFLSNYGFFLSSFIGPMLAHYFLLVRGHISVDDLFTSSKTGTYYYWKGINVRAAAAYVLGITPSLYGFAGALGVPVSVSVQRSFYFSVIIGIGISAGSYILLCALWPVPQQVPFGTKGWLEPDDVIRQDDVSDNSALSAQDADTPSSILRAVTMWKRGSNACLVAATATCSLDPAPCQQSANTVYDESPPACY